MPQAAIALSRFNGPGLPVAVSGDEALLDSLNSDSRCLQICMLEGGAANAGNSLEWPADHHQLQQLLLLRAQKLAWTTVNVSSMTRLRVLKLVDCSRLSSLEGIGCLSLLQRLEVVRCPGLTALQGLQALTALEQLRLEDTPIQQLPEVSRASHASMRQEVQSYKSCFALPWYISHTHRLRRSCYWLHDP